MSIFPSRRSPAEASFNEFKAQAQRSTYFLCEGTGDGGELWTKRLLETASLYNKALAGHPELQQRMDEYLDKKEIGEKVRDMAQNPLFPLFAQGDSIDWDAAFRSELGKP